jgi:dienelactone hydrolase
VLGSTVTVYDASTNRSTTGEARDTDFFNLDAEYLRDLFLVSVPSGKTSVLVHGRRVAWYSLSPDNSTVAYAIPKRFEKPGSLRRVYDLVALAMTNRREQVLASDILLDDVFSWSPTSSLIGYPAYGEDDQSFDYYVVGTAGSPRKVARLPYHPYDGRWRMPMWDKRGENFYFVLDGALCRTSVTHSETVTVAHIEHRSIRFRVSQSDGQLWTSDEGRSTVVIVHDDEGKQDGFYKVDLTTGTISSLLEEGQCYTCKFHSTDVRPYVTAVSGDGREMAYIAEDAQHAPDLWVADAGFGKKRQLTHLNPQFEKYKMGSARLVDWLSDDGNRLQGAVLLPAGYEVGKRYPLIVYLYPGIQSNLLDQFGFGEFPGPFNLQLFATRGYAVFLPDAPRQVGEPMASLAKSVLPGVNKVIEIGIADPARIGVMGHSNGGYSTLALIAQTDRFKAAIEADGFGDYVGFYGMMLHDGSGYQYGQAEMHLGGDIWNYPQRYIQNSPVFFLDRVETPLLIVHGSDDESVASFLGDEIFVDFRRLGKPVVYARYENESHVPEDWSCSNQTDLANRSVAWFDSHLKTSTN